MCLLGILQIRKWNTGGDSVSKVSPGCRVPSQPWSSCQDVDVEMVDLGAVCNNRAIADLASVWETCAGPCRTKQTGVLSLPTSDHFSPGWRKWELSK